MDSDTPLTPDEIRSTIAQLRVNYDATYKRMRRARSRDRQCQICQELYSITAYINELMDELNKHSVPVTLWSLNGGAR